MVLFTNILHSRSHSPLFPSKVSEIQNLTLSISSSSFTFLAPSRIRKCIATLREVKTTFKTRVSRNGNLDEKYCKGSYENLELIRNAGVKCPLLCKEFIIDAWQFYYDRSKGADAVLLIAAVLPDLDIKYMVKICKLLGLAALVEMHDEREFDRVLGIESVELIGINNLQKDIAVSHQ
ncbi:hypothetical protein KIW84_021716 [Lathyrus oleraceus]|uniref:indole-3-glycerol-phosphate synthase n=1 Tax=Pisum sativum TaxID=3888 RepID=A0A9D4YAL7_PEA|nr:hypothetical protein KIW84_021716 [Pisum sativum]